MKIAKIQQVDNGFILSCWEDHRDVGLEPQVQHVARTKDLHDMLIDLQDWLVGTASIKGADNGAK